MAFVVVMLFCNRKEPPARVTPLELPSAAPLCRMSWPALTATAPVKLLGLVSVTFAVPFKVRPVLPEIGLPPIE